jgi:ribonucleoside-diphosphate reductase alpha chain
VVSAVAQVVRYRCEQLRAFEAGGPSPVLDTCSASTSRAPAPRARCPGPSTSPTRLRRRVRAGLKEIQLPGGATRPYSIWLSGHYPRALDGLTRILSLDMRVVDPAWIGMKLRKLLDYSEPLGDFMAFVPGERRQQNWPSTVAYLARLVIHRYAMLGVLDERGFPRARWACSKSPRARGARGDEGRALPRMRQLHRDPQGRLRLLQRLRWVGVCG